MLSPGIYAGVGTDPVCTDSRGEIVSRNDNANKGITTEFEVIQAIYLPAQLMQRTG